MKSGLNTWLWLYMELFQNYPSNFNELDLFFNISKSEKLQEIISNKFEERNLNFPCDGETNSAAWLSSFQLSLREL